MKKLILFAGIPLLILGLSLHVFFSDSPEYHIALLDSKGCHVHISSIIEKGWDVSIDNDCPKQKYLIQSISVKLFLALGVLLVGSGLFLAYSKIDKK